MIRSRYFGVVSRSGDLHPHHRRRTLEFVRSRDGMQVVVDQARSLVLAQEAGVACGNPVSATAIGAIFCPGRTGPLHDFGPETQQMIVGSRGEHLIRAYWGGYICFLTSDDRFEVLRAPLGDLPCYYVLADDLIVLASCVPLLLDFIGQRAHVSPEALARYLLAEDVRRAETCLSGVMELPGGDRLSIDDNGVSIDRLWSPWTFAGADRQIDEPEEAKGRVRDAVRHAVHVQAAQAGHAVLRLSGGLDSSIVAAILADSPAPFTCVNLVTRNPSGDEVRYAHAVADCLDVPLISRLRDVGRIDVERSDARSLPRPDARAFAQETRRITEEVAAACGASIAFDGGGGDNVFCSLQSARVVTDCWASARGRPYFWPALRSVASLAQVSAFTVMRRAWAIRRRRSPGFRFPIDSRFLAADAIRDAAGALDHPWLNAPRDMLPGKAAHVSLVVTAQNVVEGLDPENALPLFSPLISQPVIEACLRVPTWLWFEDGLNRAMARRAFEDMLPGEIIRRRSKGSPDSFLIEIYDRNRPKIRDMLLGGKLSSIGLLDRPSVARALSGEGPVTGYDYFRIMRLVDVEAWLTTV